MSTPLAYFRSRCHHSERRRSRQIQGADASTIALSISPRHLRNCGISDWNGCWTAEQSLACVTHVAIARQEDHLPRQLICNSFGKKAIVGQSEPKCEVARYPISIAGRSSHCCPNHSYDKAAGSCLGRWRQYCGSILSQSIADQEETWQKETRRLTGMVAQPRLS